MMALLTTAVHAKITKVLPGKSGYNTSDTNSDGNEDSKKTEHGKCGCSGLGW